MGTPEEDKAKRDRLMRRAAVFGGALAVLCQFLPHDHRALCTAVAKFASLTCGG